MVQRDPSTLNSVTVTSTETLKELHQTIRKCHFDLDRFKFNTAIAALMEFSNHLNKIWAESAVDTATWNNCIEKFLLLLAPMAPHISEELWEFTGHSYSIHNQSYPSWDEKLAAEESITLVLQVNGKVRDRIQVASNIEEGTAQELALASPKIKTFIENKTVNKTIYVPGKLVNLVVN